MTGKAKVGHLALEQGLAGCCVRVMAEHALTSGGGFMHTPDTCCLFPLVMALQADFGRRFSQHAGIIAGMLGVARLAFPRLDRLVLRCIRDVIMTGQAEPAVKGLHSNRGPFDLVTVVAIAVPHRRVDNLPEQTRSTGTVWCVAVDAPGCDRVALMSGSKPDAVQFVTGATQVAAGHAQQL